MRRERLPQPDPIGGQVAREERVVLREAGAGAERLLPDRAREPLGERDESGPGVRVVGSRPDDEHGALRAGEKVGELRDGVVVDRARARTTRRGAARSAGSEASADQSSIGTITRAGPRPVAASWWARAIAPGTSWARTGWSTQTG